MKKQIISCILSACALAVSADVVSNEANSTSNSNATSPAVEWVKTEIQKIFQNTSGAGENLSDMVTVNVATLNQSSLVVVSGHFTNKNKTQYIVTVPGQAKLGKDLGWETNVWMLVERNDDQSWNTIATLRGDVAYEHSLIDIDNDGLQEINMVNRMSCNGCQKISYKIYSFKTASFVYSAESNDSWSNHKIAKRKHLRKGELLYNVLQLNTTDVNNDGVKEVVETWIEFRYNGGRKVSTIEQRKTMLVKTNVLTLNNGVYQNITQ